MKGSSPSSSSYVSRTRLRFPSSFWQNVPPQAGRVSDSSHNRPGSQGVCHNKGTALCFYMRAGKVHNLFLSCLLLISFAIAFHCGRFNERKQEGYVLKIPAVYRLELIENCFFVQFVPQVKTT